MPVEWNESYAVGEARIDRQHKNLFDFINRLENLIAQQRLEPSEVENLFAFLDAYVNTHFAYEELCMRLRGCPIAQKNKEAHDKFLSFWAGFLKEYSPATVSLKALEELQETLTSWLKQHICKIDVKLRQA
ncbi:bacteriohemerythrin [Meiothermus rufus]|uniref:bacteriohemerythrin n=1 Tax=Meiothermus rufus TaxID=604332 RepID=UPI0003F799D1|nr:hemerythrin family protein [Meiothermus rufus]